MKKNSKALVVGENGSPSSPKLCTEFIFPPSYLQELGLFHRICQFLSGKHFHWGTHCDHEVKLVCYSLVKIQMLVFQAKAENKRIHMKKNYHTFKL